MYIESYTLALDSLTPPLAVCVQEQQMTGALYLPVSKNHPA